LTYKAARAYKEIANLCPFYTTRKILPEELNFIQYLNKKSIQILSSQMESQNGRKKQLQIYTGIISWKAMATWLLQSAMIYIILQKFAKN